MPLEIPENVQQHFDLYPNSAGVFVREDGKTFLNHYTVAKAVLNAKKSELKMFFFTTSTAFSQTYPDYPENTHGFLYVGSSIASPVQKIEINGQEQALAQATLTGLKEAAVIAANAAGLALLAVSNSVSSGWNLNITINEAATIRVLDDDDNWITLTLD